MSDPPLRLVRGTGRRPEAAAHSASTARPGGRPLVHFVRDRLRPDEHETLRAALGRAEPVDYSEVIHRASQEALDQDKKIRHNRSRIRERYQFIADAPTGRRETVLRNLPSHLLLTLTHDLIREGYGERFSNPARSLNIAEVAVEAAELLSLEAQVEPALSRELRAEALMYLANARRINSDLKGAEHAFSAARLLLRHMTRECPLQADYASMLSTMRFVQGRGREAAALLDREIRLRERLGDDSRLGHALINRGVVATWCEELATACDYLERGVELTEESAVQLLALHALGDRLARDGSADLAWRVVCAAEALCSIVGSESLGQRQQWLRGITQRARGNLSAAERDLRAVRESFLEQKLSHSVAVVSLDLVCVLVPQQRWPEVQELAEEAYTVFRSERLESRALAAFRICYQAALKESLSEGLAVGVVNYLVRRQYDTELQFQPPE